MKEVAGSRAGLAAVYLALAVLLAWGVCYLPAGRVGGDRGVFWMSVAAVCCLVPGLLVVLVSRLMVFFDSVVVMLVQMSIRMVCVVGFAFAVRSVSAGAGQRVFLGWLVGFYLYTLLLEVLLLHPSAVRRSLARATVSGVLSDAPSRHVS